LKNEPDSREAHARENPQAKAKLEALLAQTGVQPKIVRSLPG